MAKFADSKTGIATIVGREYPPFQFEVERGRIRMFCQAIGESNPIYYDESAAKQAGYRSIPVPPTFAFTIIMEANQSFMILDDLGFASLVVVYEVRRESARSEAVGEAKR